jgi:flagellar hook protein FlgE
LDAGTRDDLISKLNLSQVGAYVTFSTDPSDANKVLMTYKATGAVASAATLSQDSSTYAVSGTADVTATTSVTTSGVTAVTAVSASAGTAEVQTLDLGTSLSNLSIGDVFTVTMPKIGGGTQSDTITLENATRADLITNLNASALGSLATFSADASNASKIVMTYKSVGTVTGLTSLTQANNPTMVRPDYIGPISINHSGSNLEIQGNPNGNPFNLNMRINGIVKASLPVGAQGSTSRNGLQVGQAKTISYSGTNELLGVGGSQTTRFVAGTGLASTAATAIGTRAITPMSQTFFLNESLGENQMTFTVDGIVGTITLPVRAYTGDTFAAAIQDRVNQIQDPKTGRIVSGVKVKFDPDNNRLIFTSGTTGPNSQINVVGHPNFGLGNVAQSPGSVPTITNLKQATDEQGNKLYVDSNGTITTQAPSSEQNWYPLYLTEGQLTFDTIGKLISPKEGVIYSPFDPQNGSDLLRLNIDYGKYSTQFSSPFSVLSLSQDGYPSGSLNGLDIDAGGTVRANYTNGQTVALGKVMIANFANPNGLKQVGNANYVATSTSGQVVLGQAGADGFGTVKAGALERSNVDITQELVNLITSQRNFQANAKAIETTEQLSQTIIQIRG